MRHRARQAAASTALLAVVLAVVLACVPAVNAAAAPKVTERSKQKQAAEAERAELLQKLNALKNDINQTETAKDNAADALADSEAAISKANRSLFDLGDEQQQTQARLEKLSKKHDELSKTVAAQQTQMATLLRRQYIAGNEDRIKLLLSGDNPNQINRELQYMGYVSKAQAKLIEELRINLQAVEANQSETQNAKDDLDEIAQEQRDQKALLEKEKAKRAGLLTQLSSKLSTQRKEAGKTARDEQRLAGLVDKLALLIEEQTKAEAAIREKRRQEQLAKAQAQALAKAQAQAAREQERQRQRAAVAKKPSQPAARQNPKAQTPAFKPDPIDDDQPPVPVAIALTPAVPAARHDPTPEAGPQEAAYGKPFAALRGLLRLPVRGDLISRFGSKHGDGPPTKGLFIRAAEGSEVKAVAAGRVAFADWLRGFGNLIIIDHGNQYMTIYGNNQALLKRPGDMVKAGDVIAGAGNSGGNEQSGLYFEIRHQGRAFDPIGWVTTR